MCCRDSEISCTNKALSSLPTAMTELSSKDCCWCMRPPMPGQQTPQKWARRVPDPFPHERVGSGMRLLACRCVIFWISGCLVRSLWHGVATPHSRRLNLQWLYIYSDENMYTAHVPITTHLAVVPKRPLGTMSVLWGRAVFLQSDCDAITCNGI